MKRLLNILLLLSIGATTVNAESIEVDTVTGSAKPIGNHTYGAVIESRKNESLDNDEDLYWLSRIISAEAKGEPFEGMIAVGNVVVNRVNSDSFPDTIKEVIFQKGQFCPVRNGSIYDEPTEEAVEAAKCVLNGEKAVGDEVLYFYNPKIVSRGNWIRTRTVEVQIGSHNFAK